MSTTNVSNNWWRNPTLAFQRILDHNLIDDENQPRRIVHANNPSLNARNYAHNAIKTSRYTLLTFIPIFTFEQFLRVANCYFLFLVIIQSIPVVSPLSPIPHALGLVFIMSLTGVKYAVDDFFRHRSDNEINHRKANIIWSEDGSAKLKTIRWQDVQVGHILALQNNEPIPADSVLLSSSEGTGLCYIETTELDGETNLKNRVTLECTQDRLSNDLNQLGTFDCRVECEQPNNSLNNFDGYLVWTDGNKLLLNKENLLLRGCTIRNTRWAFSLVVYAGRQTKLMKNAGKSEIKRTRIDKWSNKFFLSVFFIMLVCIEVATVMSYLFESGIGQRFKNSYSLWIAIHGVELTPFYTALIQMGSHFILIQTLIPIAIYITFESIQLMLSRGFINADLGMYHAESDSHAEARTTTLNEDLGQIEYIFSDKTGTLTQNIMAFNRCSIGGNVFCHENVSVGKHEFFNESLFEEVQAGSSSAVHNFFMVLALCHSVNADESTGDLVFSAQSPDEVALVSAAQNLGYIYKRRTQSSITLQILGVEVTYDLLCTLEFDNYRKRMSVIVFDKQNRRRRLFCKGADSSIFPLIRPDKDSATGTTKGHLDEFAKEGLRTLCCAVRDIQDEEWATWFALYQEACGTLDDRFEKLAICYETIERDLTLIGATAVEDKLQDGVPETILKLTEAGIKIWVLTGDKQETAISIGYMCNFLTDTTLQLIIDSSKEAEVEIGLKEASEKIINERNRGRTELPFRSVLIINGQSLHHALNEKMQDIFLKVASYCNAVICCRVAPLQKGRVVDLVKRKKEGLTLAIGDGANDVNMIKTAHIGVGISGREGRQAVLASDFAISQFRFLQRLLLIHGRRSYYRVAGFMRFFTYKTFALGLSQIWFAIYCGWSGTPIYDQWYIMTYNIIYTATPVLYNAVCEQDVSDNFSLEYPKLYQPGLTNQFFNWRSFILSEFEGIFTSAVTFFLLCYGYADTLTENGYDITTSKAAMSIAVGTATVIVVTVRCNVESCYWTLLNVTPLISIVSTFLLQYVVSVALAVFGRDMDYIGVAEAVWGSPSFWLCTIAAVLICNLPVFVGRFLTFIFKPSLRQRIQVRRLFLNERSCVHRLAQQNAPEHEEMVTLI